MECLHLEASVHDMRQHYIIWGHIQSVSPQSGQISIKISRHIVLPPEIIVGVWERLMLLINSYNLKMVAMLKPSVDYNRRATIIKSLRSGRSATEIVWFFGYPRSAVYDFVAKYTVSEQSNQGSSMSARERKNAPRGLPQLSKGLKRWFQRTQDNRCENWRRLWILWCPEGHMFFRSTVHQPTWVI